MTDYRIDQLTNITPATADIIPAWDSSAGITGQFTITQLITYLNTIYATLVGANTFTDAQVVQNNISLSAFDNGAGTGRSVVIDRNTNASTPAPGAITFRESDGGASSIFPDDSGVLRIRNGAPPNSTQITAGTVVGAQTSSLDAKDVQGNAISGNEALAFVQQTAQEGIKRFVYKAKTWVDDDGNENVGTRPYDGEEFSGIIIDFAPRYGMDIDSDHPAGKSLNIITAIGDLFLAVSYLAAQNAELQTRVSALETISSN